ncbi:MAG: DegV family protein [Anaerolineales bacterium]|nr:DegV family protein [Anaerolineales bacterium]
MSKIAIVTDSTSYLPKEYLQQYNLSITPLILIWGDETFNDGVDIQPGEFYTRLKTAKVMPSTSQATPAVMQAAFQPLVDQGFDVLGVFISSKLSGTLQSASQAKDLMGSAGDKVTLMDSLSTSLALGFITLAAARAAAGGASVQECIKTAEQARENSGIFFAVDTLEFLHRGGRIGGAQRFIGSALNLKPILGLNEGKVEGMDRIRTKSKAHDRLLELVGEKVAGKSNVRLGTLHANAEEDAQKLLARGVEQFKPVESILSEVSPVVGTHTGPGTVGIAYSFGV